MMWCKNFIENLSELKRISNRNLPSTPISKSTNSLIGPSGMSGFSGIQGPSGTAGKIMSKREWEDQNRQYKILERDDKIDEILGEHK